MNIKRILSGVLGFPLVVLLVVLGNTLVIDIGLTIIAMIAMNEYFHAVSKVCNPVKWIGYMSCLSIALIHIVPNEYLELVVTMSIPTILIILFSHIIATNMKITLKDIAYTFLGIFYVVFSIMFLAFISGMEHGKILIWYALFAAWGTDVFAYIVGKLIGKHKFSKISPNKTVEGCIGGTIGSLLFIIPYTFAINHFFQIEYSYIYAIVMGCVLSLVGQIGDFAASSIKRHVDIKDFSNLIPGHGGILDRIDSLIFLAPYAYILFTFI